MDSILAITRRWKGLTSGGAPALMHTAAAMMLGQLAVAATGMIAIRIYTELAPSRIFGEANLLLSALALGLQLVVAPFTATQLRFHVEAQRRESAEAFTRQAAVWTLRAGAVLAAAGVLGIALWRRSASLPLSAPLLVAVALWALGTSMRNLYLGRLNAERRQRLYVALLVTEALLSLAFTAVLLRQAPSTGSYITGQALAPCAVILVLLGFAPWPLWPKPDGRAAQAGFLGKVRDYGAPFTLMSLLSWLSNLADRFVLASKLGAAAAGQYVAPFTLASRALALPATALTDVFRPLLFAAEAGGDHRRSRSLFINWIASYATISLLGLTLLGVAGNALAALLLARSYRATAYGIMLWIGASYTVYGLVQILENRVLSLGTSRPLIWAMLAGAVGDVLFSFWLVSRNGLIGAAQANCLSFILQALATAIVLVSARKTTAMGDRHV